MLQFLEAGNGVYVVAVICMMGILSKCMVHSFYKRTIKQTDNMATTRNKFLKGFRQKTENTYWINQEIYNARAYIKRQIFGYHFLGISLGGWDAFAGQAVLLSLITGGIGAYLSYWYQLDSSYIILYGAVAVLSSLLLLLTEQSARIEQKQEQLVVCLQDYIENSMGRRAANRMEKEEKEMADQPKDNVIVSMERGMLRNKAEDEEQNEMQTADSKKDEGMRVQNLSARRAANIVGKRRNGRSSEVSNLDENGMVSENTKRSSIAEIESLRKSMEQTAAGKEKLSEGEHAKNAQGVDLTKILEPDQIQILGEIFKEYLK